MNKGIGPALARLVLMLLTLLIGCAFQVATCAACTPPPVPHVQPNSVVIQTLGPSPQEVLQSVTLSDPALINQLYNTIYTLPVLPENSACTLDYGPRYVLSFKQGNQPVVVVTAERFGCRKVTIDDEGIQRHGTEEFWSLLDQAIAAGTPTT
ncbi:hypothetical protein [Dictyobacter aurantiacus]|uniref:Lipoprotein n=1 Tax=Dictyobacter aurantiacus TaxID=1936993 RepID=A0A401ZJQ2_9CHLR|nr:hypothetical protein [Dictyobacter aurantiacus]GCE07054.1 hypothetical protein KDAU_43830 [Dictyobacter aurantiacus]